MEDCNLLLGKNYCVVCYQTESPNVKILKNECGEDRLCLKCYALYQGCPNKCVGIERLETGGSDFSPSKQAKKLDEGHDYPDCLNSLEVSPVKTPSHNNLSIPGASIRSRNKFRKRSSGLWTFSDSKEAGRSNSREPDKTWSISKLRRKTLNSIKVHFHPHPFVKLDDEIGKVVREKCLGSHTKHGCRGKASKDCVYFSCTSGKDIICEEGLNRPRKFKVRKPNLHSHKLYFRTKAVMEEWKCQIGREGCKKTSLDVNYGNRLCYACKTCDFQICLGGCQGN